MHIAAGDRFCCVGPAGGGYGDPLERDPHKVLDDVLDGLISTESAARDYGVVVSAGRIDTAATEALRTDNRTAPK
jgi:N-methylhydantoinase B